MRSYFIPDTLEWTICLNDRSLASATDLDAMWDAAAFVKAIAVGASGGILPVLVAVAADDDDDVVEKK